MTTIANKQTSQTESLHARISQKSLEDIDRIAQAIGRSRNWVFNEAIKQYLDVQQWQINLIQERVDEAEHKDNSFVPHDEVMKRHEKRLKKKLGI